jgi:hypothetical protein
MIYATSPRSWQAERHALYKSAQRADIRLVRVLTQRINEKNAAATLISPLPGAAIRALHR